MEHQNENLRPQELIMAKKLLGDDRICLCMAIAQVAVSQQGAPMVQTGRKSAFLSQNQTLSDWKVLLNVGVVAFTKDRQRKYYYLQAIDMDQGLVTFNHIIEAHVIFKRRRRFIITFETEFGVVCLNFVDEDEADHFSDVLDVFMSKHNNITKDRKNVVLSDQNLLTKKSDYEKLPQDMSNHNNFSTESEYVVPLDPSLAAKIYDHEKPPPDEVVNTSEPKKLSVKSKMKSWFGIKKNEEKTTKNNITKDEIKNRLGNTQFEKLLTFLKVAGIKESDFDDPLKAQQIYHYYEQNQSYIDQVDPQRSEEYGTVEDVIHSDSDEQGDIFDQYYEEDTVGVNGSKKSVSTFESNETSDIFDEYYDDKVSLPSPAPTLPPKSQPPSNSPSFTFPPKPVAIVQKEQNKKYERQLSRPTIRPPPPPPSTGPPPLQPPSAVVSAHTTDEETRQEQLDTQISGSGRGILMKSIRDKKLVLNKTPTISRQKSSRRSKKGGKDSLSDLLSGALKKIHDVNIIYGEEPESPNPDIWDE